MLIKLLSNWIICRWVSTWIICRWGMLDCDTIMLHLVTRHILFFGLELWVIWILRAFSRLILCTLHWFSLFSQRDFDRICIQFFPEDFYNRIPNVLLWNTKSLANFLFHSSRNYLPSTHWWLRPALVECLFTLFLISMPVMMACWVFEVFLVEPCICRRGHSNLMMTFCYNLGYKLSLSTFNFFKKFVKPFKASHTSAYRFYFLIFYKLFNTFFKILPLFIPFLYVNGSQQ